MIIHNNLASITLDRLELSGLICAHRSNNKTVCEKRPCNMYTFVQEIGFTHLYETQRVITKTGVYQKLNRTSIEDNQKLHDNQHFLDAVKISYMLVANGAENVPKPNLIHDHYHHNGGIYLDQLHPKSNDPQLPTKKNPMATNCK